MSMQQIATGLQFPEGPIAMPDGSVLLVEIEGQYLTRVQMDGTVERLLHIPGGPNGAAIGPDGLVYICNNGGFNWYHDPVHGSIPAGQADNYSGGRIERVDLTTGRIETLYEASDAGRLFGPNDLVFDQQGGFWFTDHGKIRQRETDIGSLCYAKADGSYIKELATHLWAPNGVGLSPDEKTVYVAETYTGRVWAYSIVAPGEINPEPFPASLNGGRLLAGLPGYQLLDSLAIDSAGNVCVATIVNGGITTISPEGEVLAHDATGDLLTTNICFGGADLCTAYITLSGSGQLVRMQWPRPGLALNFLNK